MYVSYSYAPVMGNSDSLSIIEQLSQGPSLVTIPLLMMVSYLMTSPMPYALFLDSCSMGSPIFLIVP